MSERGGGRQQPGDVPTTGAPQRNSPARLLRQLPAGRTPCGSDQRWERRGYIPSFGVDYVFDDVFVFLPSSL